MIPVTAQPKPGYFDKEVRQKGLTWLRKKNIPFDQPLPSGTKPEPYWRHCLGDLYSRYNGCCAYLAIRFELITGGGSVDHFIAKSRRPDLIYEWSNYRLACSRMNSRKRDYDDVLDPFEIELDWFHLEMITGHIYPNPVLSVELQENIHATVQRLGLDDSANREIRARHYQEYCEGYYTEAFLKKQSPFVWLEAKRQGVL